MDEKATSKEKIAWLRRYRESVAMQELLTDEISAWRSLAEKVTPSFHDAPGGNSGPGRMITAVERIEEIEARLGEVLTERCALRRQIEQAISSLPDDRLVRLMELRYIHGRTFEQVAVEMHYSYMQICRLHKKALNSLQVPKM